MTLTLYNTLSRKKAEFTPLDWRPDSEVSDAERQVRMYVCGPTVYDFAHIGNARPVIVFDVLYRLLRHLYGADKVTYVRNITDVDDKINARAAEEGVEISEITSKTTDQFHADVAALGCLEPTIEPRATEHVAEMIAMIKTLIEKDVAYPADGHVLFEVSKMAEYGKLSGRSVDDMIAGARVEVAPYKKDPMDFVLWKPSDENQPGWDSPWGRGRPGWHIECSAMSNKHLGTPFDIHGGGIDLTFPHHENEVAQSRCCFDTDKMAQVWMHNGYLQVEGKKMSKSEGNFITINELLDTEKFGGRKWPGDVLRLAMLTTHYRQPLDFSVKALEDAHNRWRRWRRWCRKHPDVEPEITDEFKQALLDDLNTPAALRLLSRYGTEASGAFFGGGLPPETPPNNASKGVAKLLGCAELLGISFAMKDVLDGKVDNLITARIAARDNKDWADADRIRDELEEMGIQLMDAKDPETGEITTTWEVKR